MSRRALRPVAALLVAVMLAAPVRARAQAYDYLVYDDTNWYQALLQFIQMVQQVRILARDARRLPLDMVTRYRGYSVNWSVHALDARLQYAQRILAALNTGDATGSAYRQVIQSLEVPAGAVARMPPNLQRRVANAYAGIELADSASALAVDQMGRLRTEGAKNLLVAATMERDAASTNDDLQTQTSVLNKINAAAVLQLRMQDHMQQSLMSTLEQLLVANRRQRDSEAALLNATLHQWQYGRDYGADLFRNTAAALDGWRPY
ncbi:MAG: hypothetical protein ABS36_06345 [Acidobacteria bacterium SCN 69-37]|nr:MAG: hypothetical protein ABS36_06345 [Acidobacteria bacterium SCN 69-37]